MRFRMIIIPIMLITFAGLGCAAGVPQRKPAVQPPRKGMAQTEQKTVSKLPWEKDSEFVRTRQEAGAPVLMASYKATLPDPILYERHNISRAADLLRGAVVKPGEVFALNARIGWRSAERGFKPGPMYSGGRVMSTVGGGVCKIASVIYNVAILADQEIVERYPHSMTVPYVPPGQDATISYGTKDFKFRNTTGGPILIWAQNTGGTLYMAFYGITSPPAVRWEHQTLSQSDTWTEYTTDPALPKGAERVVHEGSKGIIVHSWIIVGDGAQEVKKDLGISAYRPCPRVMARGR